MSAQVISFPTPERPEPETKEVRIVADCDEGYTRLANTLLEALCRVDITPRQMRVFLAIVRKTYGYQKKSDWVSPEQIAKIIDYEGCESNIRKDISTLKKRLLVVKKGPHIGPNPVITDWLLSVERPKKDGPKQHKNVSISTHESVESDTKTCGEQPPQKKEEKPKENINKPIVGKPDEPSIPEQVISYLNFKAGKRFQFTKNNLGFINARIKEGFTLDDFRGVIDRKVAVWLHDPKMNQYLRPKTLFSSDNFDSYVNAAIVPAGINQIPNGIPTQPAGQQYAPAGHQKPQSNREQVSDALTDIHDTDW
ncbi:conserved phage C-terminal domain-containing protein [Marinomonas atlantica]|uniref:conserved phage C-terminal domain-containing protein n=1 Tax=Marinomonas atlantica TaxID=1806668 RepID=UPI00083174D9|nr:conserved phage C-terminal domain-containing protein [Marinomonas atlantica]